MNESTTPHDGNGEITDGAELAVDSRATVVTENSVWLFTPTHYLRMPKTEAPRAYLDDPSPRLADGLWMEYLKTAWWVEPDGTRRLRIWPAAPPGLDGHGITTGVVLRIAHSSPHGGGDQ